MGSEGEIGEEIQPRTYWRWSKQDFLPEESFQSWSAYQTALSQTHHRFKDRLISRSNDANETVELRKQSENDMKRCLTWWDLIWFGFGSVIGAGIFVLTGQETHDHAFMLDQLLCCPMLLQVSRQCSLSSATLNFQLRSQWLVDLLLTCGLS